MCDFDVQTDEVSSTIAALGPFNCQSIHKKIIAGFVGVMPPPHFSAALRAA
jgi:hypothetical protein